MYLPFITCLMIFCLAGFASYRVSRPKNSQAPAINHPSFEQCNTTDDICNQLTRESENKVDFAEMHRKALERLTHVHGNS